ncbi:pilus assembly protein TadG-related protein [Dyella acidiphila]|uniref:Putative Flp pilus-assembly TadG-like N-terminal domain-containing protein n=1 Tax=Dyella acidiphila TaxID=2775866 RepID=A0ABR9G9Z1_9GAMM|nr:pilus assembly protein TadG-related protein [Dyella acidiphila]MBE1160824.1 hypothetical protein [Dyella acidiphila]
MDAFVARPSLRRHRRHAQAGSMAINMMLILLSLIAMLGLVEIGYVYWAKRDTQKVADLAALAGAQQLQDCNAANSDNSAARGNATNENHFGGNVAINCGTWSAAAASGTADGFSNAASGATPTAVQVIAERPVTPFFAFTPALPNVSAKAVATTTTPLATFSIGTTLVDVSGAAPLQNFLAGIGINASGSSLVGYQGLANVYITPAGLLQQLGVQVPTNLSVGQLNTLLSAQTNAQALINVLNAVVTVGGQSTLTSANATLLNTISAALGNIPLNLSLGSNDSTPSGLFAQIVGPDSSVGDALNTQVNALQLLEAAIGVATTGHAISAQSVNLNLPFGINVTAAASVIEPPSIGIGGVGATAYTAQVRVFLDITTSGNSLLGSSGLIKLNVNLPIAIDVANAQATLTSLCNATNASGAPLATLAVTSSVLKMCVGNITQANAFSTSASCDQIPGASTASQLFGLSAAGANLASLTTSFNTNALTGSSSVTLAPGQSAITGDALNIGTSLNNLVTALSAALLANTASQTGSTASSIAGQTATDLWNDTNTKLSYPQRAQQALQEIQSASTGLQGTLGNVTTNVSSLLGNTLQLNVPGVLSDVGSLLGNVTNVLSGILNNLGCTLGNQTSCINVISGAMAGGTGTGSNAFVGLIGFLLQALQQPLDDVGSQVLTPLLNFTGLQLGQNTVTLHSLMCHNVQLVY